MGIFNSTCCPPKPRRTVDYILNWIDKYGPIITKDTSYINDLLDWRRTVENELDGYVKNAADEYITNYDWSQVPEFDAKADKVKNATAGNFASLDSNGNLIDSGVNYDESIEEGNYDLATCNAVYVALQEKVDKVANATANNFASLDENGNIQDSRRKPTDFADADHEHNYIADFRGSDSFGASVSVGEGYPGAGVISLSVKGNGQSTDSKTAEIDYSSIDNLNRALATPSSTPENDSTKLITSKAVFDALAGKANSVHTHHITDINNLIDTIISLSDRVRELEGSPVNQTITCSATYFGYVQYVYNEQSIIYNPNPNHGRDLLYNLPSELYNLAQVGSKVIVRSNGTQILETHIIEKQTGPDLLRLKDAIPNDSYVTGTTINITISE